ncbi:MAG: hypothetical protein JZU63_12910, partial [Rhodoferax sp.]|nr:hypothetical protein [Rhodoferax sp.]
QKATGEYLFFVNNDLVFTGDCLTVLANWLESDDNVGIVGMQLVEPLPEGVGRWKFAAHHRGIHFVPKQSSDGLNYFPEEIDDTYSGLGLSYHVPAVTGAALMCRKAEFLDVGGFDNAYFYGL